MSQLSREAIKKENQIRFFLALEDENLFLSTTCSTDNLSLSLRIACLFSFWKHDKKKKD